MLLDKQFQYAGYDGYRTKRSGLYSVLIGMDMVSTCLKTVSEIKISHL